MTAVHTREAQPAALEPAAPGTSYSRLPLLAAELECTSTSFMEPEAFFVSWQGVLTLAYRGFTQPLIDLKDRIAAAHPSLPPENPGSKWPKTSLGCLRDGRRLTPAQLATLVQICREESAAFKQQQQQQQQQRCIDEAPGTADATETAAAAAAAEAGGGIRLAIDSAAVVLFECRSLERLLNSQPVIFRGGIDTSPPSPGEVARVAAIVAEQDSEDYWFAASKDGHRESHYRGVHLGATLMHPLLGGHWGQEEAGEGAQAAAGRPGLRARGPRELADRRALLAAIARFQRQVDSELPGMYAWFEDRSLHITLRALVN